MLRSIKTTYAQGLRATRAGHYTLITCLLLAGLMLTVPAMAADTIGAVEKVTGECLIIRGTDTLKAEAEQPVMLKDEISTKEGAHISIVFLDETKLTLDESSHASIDSYVYSDKSSDLLFKFTKGTFRTITGEIVKKNPEGFNMETPLATIGIRGSDVYAIVQPEGEEAGALHLGDNHTVEVETALQKVSITESGLRVKIYTSGIITPPSSIPPATLKKMKTLGPSTPVGGAVRTTVPQLQAPPPIIPKQEVNHHKSPLVYP